MRNDLAEILKDPRSKEPARIMREEFEKALASGGVDASLLAQSVMQKLKITEDEVPPLMLLCAWRGLIKMAIAFCEQPFGELPLTIPAGRRGGNHV